MAPTTCEEPLLNPLADALIQKGTGQLFLSQSLSLSDIYQVDLVESKAYLEDQQTNLKWPGLT